MKTIKGTVRNGQIAIFEPIVWPEGTEVRVRPIRGTSANQGRFLDSKTQGDDDVADDAESIARWIDEFDAIPAMQMTADEEAQWMAARRAQKEKEASAPNDMPWDGGK